MTQPCHVLAAVPTPPPYSGPEMNGAQLLDAGLPGIVLHHVRTNVHDVNAIKGRVTLTSLARLAVMWWKTVVTMMTVRPRIFYIFLSQNTTGFLRDAVLIWTARVLGARVVVHLRGGNLRAFRDHAPRWVRGLVRHTLRRVSRACVEGASLVAGLADVLPPAHIAVVPNVIDFTPPPAAPRSAGTCTVLFMGHLSLAKGFGDWLTAAPSVLAADPRVRLEIAGAWLLDERNIRTGHAVRNLPAEAERLSATSSGRVRVLGVVAGDARLAAFARADVLVLPSYSEGLPMVVLEAMACGIPVVVTPVGAIPEVVTDGVHGRVVPVGDPAALADAVVTLVRDEASRARMGAAAAARVAQAFSPGAGAARLAAVFTDAAA